MGKIRPRDEINFVVAKSLQLSANFLKSFLWLQPQCDKAVLLQVKRDLANKNTIFRDSCLCFESIGLKKVSIRESVYLDKRFSYYRFKSVAKALSLLASSKAHLVVLLLYLHSDFVDTRMSDYFSNC